MFIVSTKNGFSVYTIFKDKAANIVIGIRWRPLIICEPFFYISCLFFIILYFFKFSFVCDFDQYCFIMLFTFSLCSCSLLLLPMSKCHSYKCILWYYLYLSNKLCIVLRLQCQRHQSCFIYLNDYWIYFII